MEAVTPLRRHRQGGAEMKRCRKWRVHVNIQCEDCNFEASDYSTGLNEAREHALKTGHHVHGEVAYAVDYCRVDKVPK